jgi:foldase protein PrsA
MAAAKKTASRKKTAPKRTKTVKPVEEMSIVEMETETIDTSSVKKMSTKSKVAILTALVVIGVVLYLSRGLLLAASVNGQFIYRPTVISELEKRGGKQELDSLVTEMLIQQEAKKKNITVTDDELNAEITKISDSVKAQGQDINTLLAMQGMTQDDLKKQVRTQKFVEKILADKVKPTDQEVADYLKTNKDSLPKGNTEAQNKDLAVSQLTQQKLSTEFQTWLTEAKKNASIKYYTNY